MLRGIYIGLFCSLGLALIGACGSAIEPARNQHEKPDGIAYLERPAVGREFLGAFTLSYDPDSEEMLITRDKLEHDLLLGFTQGRLQPAQYTAFQEYAWSDFELSTPHAAYKPTACSTMAMIRMKNNSGTNLFNTTLQLYVKHPGNLIPEASYHLADYDYLVFGVVPDKESADAAYLQHYCGKWSWGIKVYADKYSDYDPDKRFVLGTDWAWSDLAGWGPRSSDVYPPVILEPPVDTTPTGDNPEEMPQGSTNAWEFTGDFSMMADYNYEGCAFVSGVQTPITATSTTITVDAVPAVYLPGFAVVQFAAGDCSKPGNYVLMPDVRAVALKGTAYLKSKDSFPGGAGGGAYAWYTLVYDLTSMQTIKVDGFDFHCPKGGEESSFLLGATTQAIPSTEEAQIIYGPFPPVVPTEGQTFVTLLCQKEVSNGDPTHINSGDRCVARTFKVNLDLTNTIFDLGPEAFVDYPSECPEVPTTELKEEKKE